MPTWQIFAGAGNSFRWEISDQQLPGDEALAQPCADSHRLPSMADLLFQGCSKLMENGKGNSEKIPAFRTARGKSVAIKESSIAKARSILGELDDDLTDSKEQLDGRANGYYISKPAFHTSSVKPTAKLKSGLQKDSENVVNMSNSMFQTGSGKAVNISSAGLLKAKTLLGLEENCGSETFHSCGHSRKQFAGVDITTKNLTDLEFNGFPKVPDFKYDSHGRESEEFGEDIMHSASKPPPIKFHTAGGRSLSVSRDALQRARSLLGDPELEFLYAAETDDPVSSLLENGISTPVADKENDCDSSFQHEGLVDGYNSSKNFTSPLKPSSYQQKSLVRLDKIAAGNNLIKKFNEEALCTSSSRSRNAIPCYRGSVNNKSDTDQLRKGFRPRSAPPQKSSNGALADISNIISIDGSRQSVCGKRRLGTISSVSPFKRPRISKFVTPLNKNNPSVNGLSMLASKESCCRKSVSMRYPVQVPRVYIKEHILQRPSLQKELESLPDQLRKMSPDAAENYTFHNDPDPGCTTPDNFYRMLVQSGASMQILKKEWVLNHYKWIVWKLASYERCNPAKFAGKLLTVSNVLEELKYRYEREVNHGHRSALKKILDGDIPASSMMVLCISSISGNRNSKTGQKFALSEGAYNDGASKIELTDGWYSVKAVLDELLAEKLAARKLFLGQKLRIWGARLCGWVGPISPLEASETTSLLLHMNGTYRCHWAERLGFCKSSGIPLAFRCIKSSGGAIPSTLVGITRIYPVLYRQRLREGSFVVRSGKMEAKVVQLYNQRRSNVAEGIMSEFEREEIPDVSYDHGSEEGAKIFKLLETAAEPEVLMAGMSSKQLSSFASYKAKLEEMRQSEMQQSMQKALESAGLKDREVTPLMRVKVVGLTNKNNSEKGFPRKGLITIWNPTEKQKLELVEGQAYAVGGLVPYSSDADTLYLQAGGSTSKWLHLSPLVLEQFVPFFTPRLSTTILSLGEVPLSSEFDIAAFIVHVGEVYVEANQKKQWVFVTDGTMHELYPEKLTESLLAISFCLPHVECDTFPPVNYNVAGSVAGFSDLIKRPKDRVNGIWVAEANEYSDYFLSYDHLGCYNLKDAATSILKWVKTASMRVERLKKKVVSIIRNPEARK